MDKLYLETPTIERKNDVLDYLEEFVEYNSDLNGMGAIDKCLEGITYEECLLELKRREDPKYVKSINRCLSKTFFVVRLRDDKIVGMVNIRYKISKERFEAGASHIGYSIRPTERKKGYAKISLYLSLLEEQKLGEERVLLDCTVDNIGSNKTIQALGGVLEKTAFDFEDETMTNYYWIDVFDSITKFQDYYQDYTGGKVLK